MTLTPSSPAVSSLKDAAHTTGRVRRIITSRAGGFSDEPYKSFNLSTYVGDVPVTVARNRERLAEVLHLPPRRVVYMDQRDTAHVAIVSQDDQGELLLAQGEDVPTTDALVTSLTDVALVVLFADNIPVLLADEEAGIIAAVHIGPCNFRGPLLARTLALMEHMGARKDHMHALLGPSAGPAPRPSVAQAEEQLSSQESAAVLPPNARRDVARYLVKAGLAGVTVDPRTTVGDWGLFSQIRDHITGRQAAVIWRSQDD